MGVIGEVGMTLPPWYFQLTGHAWEEELYSPLARRRQLIYTPWLEEFDYSPSYTLGGPSGHYPCE
jgi:hypothetical protein